MSKRMFYIIEELVDKSSVADVLIALKNVCLEKADHIDSNYGDIPLSNRWVLASDKIGKAISQLPKVTGIK